MYSLIAKNKNTDIEHAIVFNEHGIEGKMLVENVSAIDHLTTRFKSEGDLVTRLYNHGYIDFINAKLYIKYPYNGRYFNLPILYLDKFYIRNLVKFNKCDISNSQLLEQFCNEKIGNADSELLQYLSHSSKIKNQHFQSHMDSWINKCEYEFYESMLTDLKRSYKTFRDMIVAIDTFEMEKIPDETEQLSFPLPEVKSLILKK